MMDPADAFLAHVNQLADNAGIELDDEDLRAIFEESLGNGPMTDDPRLVRGEVAEAAMTVEALLAREGNDR